MPGVWRQLKGGRRTGGVHWTPSPGSMDPMEPQWTAPPQAAAAAPAAWPQHQHAPQAAAPSFCCTPSLLRPPSLLRRPVVARMCTEAWAAGHQTPVSTLYYSAGHQGMTRCSLRRAPPRWDGPSTKRADGPSTKRADGRSTSTARLVLGPPREAESARSTMLTRLLLQCNRSKMLRGAQCSHTDAQPHRCSVVTKAASCMLPSHATFPSLGLSLSFPSA